MQIFNPLRDKGGFLDRSVLDRSVSNFLKVHTLHFKTAHLRISSPLGERIKVRGIYLETTLTPTLSRQRERENHGFS
jgi:hypothetical protein